MTPIVTHDAPVWRHHANKLIRADLSSSGFPDGMEELWLNSKEPNIGLVCCIPFFLNGVALGDLVEFDGNDRLTSTQIHNGHCVVRIAVVNENDDQRLHIALHALINQHGLVHEWRSAGYVAVDIPPHFQDTDFMDALKNLSINEAIQFEIC